MVRVFLNRLKKNLSQFHNRELVRRSEYYLIRCINIDQSHFSERKFVRNELALRHVRIHKKCLNNKTLEVDYRF